jgi:hypothetical protein
MVFDHDPKFTSALFQEFMLHIGNSLLLVVGSVYHINTNARTELVTGMPGKRLSLSVMSNREHGGQRTSSGTFCTIFSSSL